MNRDLHSLAGAYALDALTDDDRAEFEEHLDQCTDCRTEVDEFLATSARIGAAVATAPPDGLKDRVLADVAATRQRPPVPKRSRADPRHAGGMSRVWRRLTGLAVAATIVALAAVAVTIVVQQRHVTEAREHADRISEVIAAPDARLLREDVTGGGAATLVISGDHDTAVMVLSGLPTTKSDHTYQLWFIGKDGARSAGTIDIRQPAHATRFLNGPGAADAIGLTIEPQGGSPQPTTKPVLALEL